MTDPQTRPSEIARIAKLASGDTTEWRTEVLILLMSSKEAVKRLEQWQVSHDRLDNERHDGVLSTITAIKGSIAALSSSLGGAVSGVGDYNDTKSQVLGAKKFALGLIAAIGAIGACILFLIAVAKELKP